MSDLLVDRQDAVAVLTLNRPDQRNSIGGELLGELLEGVEAADAEPDVRAIVTTGGGPTYCVGADINTLTALSGSRMDLGLLGTDGVGGRTGLPVLPLDHRRVDHQGMGRWVTRFMDIGTPTVAAINGAAAGGGLAITLLHDVRIMSRTAKLAVGFNVLGFAPEMGMSWILPRLIGQAAAFRLLTSPAPIDADEALELGLVEQVVEPADLLETAVARAQTFTAMPDRYVRVAKRLLRQSWDGTLSDQVEREWTVQRMLFADDQAQAAVEQAVLARGAR
jgi:2-(1,2-epoxy-1,2-dihydrophenyl)acetyl-CoA isomerase